MILLFTYIIFVIIYGIARATQQATLFNYRDKIQNPEWIDETSEIHFAGWFEPVSLVFATLSFIKIGIFDYHFIILVAVCSYFFYFLPYAITFNKIRGRKWFKESHIYLIKLFGKELRFKLPGLTDSINLFLLSVISMFLAYYLITNFK